MNSDHLLGLAVALVLFGGEADGRAEDTADGAVTVEKHQPAVTCYRIPPQVDHLNPFRLFPSDTG